MLGPLIILLDRLRRVSLPRCVRLPGVLKWQPLLSCQHTPQDSPQLCPGGSLPSQILLFVQPEDRACSPVLLMTFLRELTAGALWSWSVAPGANWIKCDSRELSGSWMLHASPSPQAQLQGISDQDAPGCRALSCVEPQAAIPRVPLRGLALSLWEVEELPHCRLNPRGSVVQNHRDCYSSHRA